MELKGTIGNLGRAKGPVKLIKSESDLGSIETGDVVVMEHSTAAIIKVMSKAAAIITDHGGLTAHAALLSREHRIPCVVGTQNATKLLTNGQEVMVDANIGSIFTFDNNN